MAEYNLYLTDDHGVRIGTSASQPLATLNNVIQLEAAREVNRVGSLYLQLPLSFDADLLARDRMVQVWRAPTGGRMKLWRPYFIRRWRFENSDGREIVHIWGYDPNHLLTRRIVAAYASETESEWSSEYADDLLKAVVTDAMQDSTPATSAGSRAWADLSVAGNLSDGPQLSMSIAWQRLLFMSGAGALGKVVRAAREAGTEVFFDIAVSNVSATSISYEFRTYTGQPGRNLSSGTNRVLFDMLGGSLENPSLEYDYSREVNYAYAGGQGQENQRNIQQVSDSNRYNLSQWNRCEDFADARNQESDNGVREAGRALLDDNSGRIVFRGDLMDTEQTRFGLDWDWGDKVVIKYRNREMTSIVRAVVLSVRDKKETIRARIDEE